MHYLIVKYLKLFIVQKILIQKQKYFLRTELNILTVRCKIIKFFIIFMYFLAKKYALKQVQIFSKDVLGEVM